MDIQNMISDYANWLKSKITVEKFGEYYELTTPFLDRYNDYFQIYIKQCLDGSIEMTDDGYILNNLINSGVSLNTKKRKGLINNILKNYSLELHNNEIMARGTIDTFPQIKHQMVQAMLLLDDMFELSPENVKDFFIDDVQLFFDKNEIYYTKNFSLIGKTGTQINYEFHFQRTKNKPERFCKTINRINEQKRNITIFNWIDTLEKRNNEGNLIILLNDENKIKTEDINAFKSYSIHPILFSNKKEIKNMVSAS